MESRSVSRPRVLVVDDNAAVLEHVACVLEKAFEIVEDAEVVRAVRRAGVLGYVVKRRMATDLVPALYSVLADRPFVSPIFTT